MCHTCSMSGVCFHPSGGLSRVAVAVLDQGSLAGLDLDTSSFCMAADV